MDAPAPAPLRYRSDNGPGTRATLGLVVLQTDETIEYDFRAFVPADGVALYCTRIPFAPVVTEETLARMQDDLARSVALLPSTPRFDAIGYGCTSGSAVIGEGKIAEIVNSVVPNAAVTNPLTAGKAALSALGAHRIAIVTPYVPSVSSTLIDRFKENGIETVALTSFELLEDAAVARVTPDSILDAIVETGNAADCDAVFVSCTSLRTGALIPEAEDRLKKPVITSNQALAWHMLRLAGLADVSAPMGRLARTG